MKGVILAAGKGTRLCPASSPISKILLTIYDKPMVYYPLSLLMSAGIKDILIIASLDDSERFKKTLGDGSQFGIRITYDVQKVQRGIADAFVIAREFIGGERIALALGDNIYCGPAIDKLLSDAVSDMDNASVFAIPVPDPERFGVVEIDSDGQAVSLEEKPSEPKSNLAVTGFYIYGPEVCDIAETLEPSARGELEITDINRIYMEKGNLKVRVMPEDTYWADTGTFDSLLDTSSDIRRMQREGNTLIGSPELVALRKEYITGEQLREWISRFKSNPYFDYLSRQI